MSKIKTCTRCHSSFQEPLKDFFHKKSNAPDGLQQRCKTCIKILHQDHYKKRTDYYKDKACHHNKKYRQRNQEMLFKYLSEHPCVNCGQTNPLLLDFDHRQDKEYNVSHMLTMSEESILEEIQKCDIRCSHCHRLKTAVQFGWYQNIRPEIFNMILRTEIKQKEFTIEAYERDIRIIRTGINSRGRKVLSPSPNGGQVEEQQIKYLKNQIDLLKSLMR
jgi:hypothetical protein